MAAAAPAVVTPAVVAPVQESSPMPLGAELLVEKSLRSGGSAFGFLSQSSVGSQLFFAKQSQEVDYSASLEQGTTRKKTRKALVSWKRREASFLRP